MLPPPSAPTEVPTLSLTPPAAIQSPEPALASAIPTRQRPEVDLPIAPNAPPVRAAATLLAQNLPARVQEAPPDDDLRELEKQREQETRSAERLQQAELAAKEQRELARQEQLRQDVVRAEQARVDAAKLEAARQEQALQLAKMEQEAARITAVRKDEARQEALRQEALRQENARQEGARQETLKKEAATQEAARHEAAKQEAARQEAAKLETARQDAARKEAAREDAAKQESARQSAAKQEAARQEAARLEAARKDAARKEAEREETAKQEAARQAAAKQEAARQDAARQERAKLDQAQREREAEEAKREERLRAIGKQLNEEAAKRDAALNQPSSSPLPTVSSLRRGWLLGRADPNNDLVLYAEAMARKIEMNMTFDMVREAVKQRHVQPVVTVAVRADGSVEKITFVVSSGVPAIDEAVRQVVASQAPYARFSPALERRYDVIEIRRTWVFDTAIRLQ